MTIFLTLKNKNNPTIVGITYFHKIPEFKWVDLKLSKNKNNEGFEQSSEMKLCWTEFTKLLLFSSKNYLMTFFTVSKLLFTIFMASICLRTQVSNLSVTLLKSFHSLKTIIKFIQKLFEFFKIELIIMTSILN